jgi:hypothetical protein
MCLSVLRVQVQSREGRKEAAQQGEEAGGEKRGKRRERKRRGEERRGEDKRMNV